MQQTNNYGLNQWELTDLIKMEDFNGDNSKVDAALKTLAGQVASKANSATVSSLSTKVNTKAAQSDLTAAVNRVTALESGKAEKTALAAEQTARENADSTEKAAREAADTALRNENCWVKLKEWTETSNTALIELDMSDIDWSAYRKAELTISLQSNSSSSLYMRVNGLDTSIYLDGDRSDTVNFMFLNALSIGGMAGSIQFMQVPGGALTGTISTMGLEGSRLVTNQTGFMVPSVKWADLDSLQIYFSQNYSGKYFQDRTFTLYGLKK